MVPTTADKIRQFVNARASSNIKKLKIKGPDGRVAYTLKYNH